MDNVWKLLTVFIAAMVLWVGLQQWWLARERFRFDLYAKRYSIFDATRKFIGAIVREGKVDRVAQGDFWTNTVDTQFLFEKDVIDYVDKVHKSAVRLHYHFQMRNSKPSQAEDHINKETEYLTWFSDQLKDDGMAQVFLRYMKFQDLRGPVSNFAAWLRNKFHRKAQS